MSWHGPTLEIQILLLRDAIREHRDHPEALKRMYEAYRMGDHRNLAVELEQSIEAQPCFCARAGCLQ
jgi:hypothetical protein